VFWCEERLETISMCVWVNKREFFMLIIHVFVMSSPSVKCFKRNLPTLFDSCLKKPFNQKEWSYWTNSIGRKKAKKFFDRKLNRNLIGKKSFFCCCCCWCCVHQIQSWSIFLKVSSINRVLRNLVSTKEQSVAHHQVFKSTKKEAFFHTKF